MMPPHKWEAAFGDIGAQLCEKLQFFFALAQGDATYCDPDIEDVMEITPDAVWTAKGPRAPGAIDPKRRLETYDVAGIRRQLIFPSFGIVGLGMYFGVDFDALVSTGKLSRSDAPELKQLGQTAVWAYNDWIIQSTEEVGSDRSRFVGVMLIDSLDQMISDADYLVGHGVRGVMLPSTAPPAGVSPASPDMDPFWTYFEEANVPVLLHLGTEFQFLDPAWTSGPNFILDPKCISLECPIMNAHLLTTCGMASENYLAALVLGGVFERHPRLRFGVIELTSMWLPNLVERMELCNYALSGKPEGNLPLRPSEYVARNVRVTPFHFEPVDRLLTSYPKLADVFVFSTDYPHVEGGRNSFTRFFEKVAPLGDDITEKFFVKNGEWLLPD